MNCPSEIASIILEILKTGILRIRSLSFSHQGERCSIEADHIHNLPDILKDYAVEKLNFYWSIERPAFIRQRVQEDLAMFTPLWSRLAKILDSFNGPKEDPLPKSEAQVFHS